MPATPAQGATPAPGTAQAPAPVAPQTQQAQTVADAASAPSLPVQAQATAQTATATAAAQPATPAPPGAAQAAQPAIPATSAQPAQPGVIQTAAQPGVAATPATPAQPVPAQQQAALPVTILAAAPAASGDAPDALSPPRGDAAKAERAAAMAATRTGTAGLANALTRAAPQAQDPLQLALARLGITANSAPAPDKAASPDQPITLTSISQADAAAMRALPAQAAAPPAQPALPVGAIAMQVAAQARAGSSRFEIRLDPPELGRVDVRLDVGRDGTVQTRMVVERAETLDLLQRDARALERALNNAGLKTDDGSLNFSLKGERFAGQDAAPAFDGQSAPQTAETDTQATHAATVQAAYALMAAGRGGIDIRV